jgi:hypothetical protein
VFDGRAANAPNFAAGGDGLIANGGALVPGNVGLCFFSNSHAIS